jgi:tetratricopeptide (TPR) repeat protein
MTGKRKSTTLEVDAMVIVYLLLCLVMFFAGCGEPITTTGPFATTSGPVRAAGMPTPSPETAASWAAKSEAELLAELDRKFENPDAHAALGELYHASKQWAKAEYHYNIALSFDPAQRVAQVGMVKMQIDRGLPNGAARAENYARNYISQASGSPKEVLKLGEEFSRQGLNEYALTCFKQGLSIAPDSPDANRHLGFYYLKVGDKTRAKECLTRSFELNPNQPDVAGALGRLGVVVQAPREPASSR